MKGITPAVHPHACYPRPGFGVQIGADAGEGKCWWQDTCQGKGTSCSRPVSPPLGFEI